MNPIQTLIDDALQFVRASDKHWEAAQPLRFKRKVVSKWKDKIRSEVSGTCIKWTLVLGPKVFTTYTGIFVRVKDCYNPYGTEKCFCI